MSFRQGEAPSTSQESSTALPGQMADGSAGNKNNSPGRAKGVHWVDMHGYELAEVREFEASSDEEEAEEYNYEKKGCCIVC